MHHYVNLCINCLFTSVFIRLFIFFRYMWKWPFPQLWKNGTGFWFSEPRLATTNNGAMLGRKNGEVVRLKGRSSANAMIRKEQLFIFRLAYEMAESKQNNVKQTSVTFTKGAFREPRLLVRSNSSADHRGVPSPCQCFASPRRSTVLGGHGHPSNNKGGHSAGRIWWILAPEVLHVGSTIPERSWGGGGGGGHAWSLLLQMLRRLNQKERERLWPG